MIVIMEDSNNMVFSYRNCLQSCFRNNYNSIASFVFICNIQRICTSELTATMHRRGDVFLSRFVVT